MFNNKDENIYSHGAWLGGFFEIAGMVSLQQGTTKRMTLTGIREHTYVYPVITYADDNPRNIKALQENFGGEGRLRNRSKKSWEYKAQKRLAFQLGEAMYTYAPSRQEILLAFQNIQTTESLEEKLQIRQETRQRQRQKVTSEAYFPFVQNPEFIAGVLDARGMLGHNENYGSNAEDPDASYVYPKINICSTNRPLLEAIKRTYGGHDTTLFYAGDQTEIDGEQTIITKDSVRWEVNLKDTQNLVGEVSPYLLLKREEFHRALN